MGGSGRLFTWKQAARSTVVSAALVAACLAVGLETNGKRAGTGGWKRALSVPGRRTEYESIRTHLARCCWKRQDAGGEAGLVPGGNGAP